MEDAARAHLAALEQAPRIGFDTFILSASTPFAPGDALLLKRDARAVIARHFPQAADLYARHGWELPASIGRVYDARRAERVLGYRCATDFAAILDALDRDQPLPFAHDPDYISPQLRA